MSNFDTFLFILVIMAICGPCMWYIAKESDKIHKRLKEILVQAQNACTVEELEDAQVALIVYANKHCWHRAHAGHAKEVLAYIKGRLGVKK